MKKVLAAAFSLLFILALSVPGFADGDTIVAMDVANVVSPEDCEWTLTIPVDFSVNFTNLYLSYENFMTNHPEGATYISAYPDNPKTFSLDFSGLSSGYKISTIT